MSKFLNALLEGEEVETPANTDEPAAGTDEPISAEDAEVDEECVKSVKECGLPMGTLIEAFVTDSHAAILEAIEVYEVACVVGGVQVVKEGLGTEGAQELLEANIKEFGAKIGERLKKIKNTVGAILTNISDKVSANTKQMEKLYMKYKNDFQKNFEENKFSFSGVIINNKEGDKLYAKIVKALNDELNSCAKYVNEKVKGATPEADPMEESDGEDTYTSGMYAKVGKAAGISDCSSASDVTKALREKFGLKEAGEGASEGDGEHMVTKKESSAMSDVVLFATKTMEKNLKADVAKFNRTCDAIITSISRVAKERQGMENSVKDLGNLITEVLALGELYGSVANAYMAVYSNSAQAYVQFIKKVATSGAGEPTSGVEEPETEEAAAEESLFYAHLFESEEIEDLDPDLADEAQECGDAGSDPETDPVAAEESAALVNGIYRYLK